MNKLFHDCMSLGEFRSVSSNVFFGHKALDPQWVARAVQFQKEWITRQVENNKGGRKVAEIGEIDCFSDEQTDVQNNMCAELLKTLPFEVAVDEASLEYMILVCAGANYHTDLHLWDNSVFLNWYLIGPPMDLVFPNDGIRRTIYPGDIYAFDPSQVHGLTTPGQPCISKDDWHPDAVFTPAPHSFFLSLDFQMTPETDKWFDIVRGDSDSLTAKGFEGLDEDKNEPCKKTGAWIPKKAQ